MLTHPENWRFPNFEFVELKHRDVVICDIDGVLSDARGRQHFLTRTPPDWQGFFLASEKDPPIQEYASHLDTYPESVLRVLLTGRPIEVQEETVRWLARQQIVWNLLIMRDFGDYSVAVAFKKAMAERLMNIGTNVIAAIDDDPSICEMYESIGIPTTYVHSGYYETVVNPPS